MTKLYYAVPALNLVAGMLALVLIGMVPAPTMGLSIVLWRTLSVLAFGTATWLTALTFLVPNRFGLYANTLLLVVFVTLLTTFGRHAIATLGLQVFGGVVGLSLLLIIWLHQQLPRQVKERDYR